jgi:phosphoglucomutase
MASGIKFGTSGWRAIIADEFTFANVRLVTEAIARFIKRNTSSPTLLVGYDTRFASENFAGQVARVLSRSGIGVQLSTGPVPTPALSFSTRLRKLDGAINITASHNADGAPVLPEVTGEIEDEIDRLHSSGWTFSGSADDSLVSMVDIRDEYLDELRGKIHFDWIRESGIRIGYDPLHGAGAGYLDYLLESEGLQPFVLHAERDVYFGGDHPEPDAANLAGLQQAMLSQELTLGLGTDGDADRFGMLDASGDFFYPNEILALLLDYLIETRGWAGPVARTVATTHLIDRVAKLNNLEILETPVGFKFIGEYIKQDRIILGCEESAGLAVKGHIPEKDGILACLLVAEMVAHRGKSLKEKLKTLFSRTGEVYNRRLNVKLDPSTREAVRAKIASDVQEYHGRPVQRQDRTDGLKLIFGDGSWVLMRLSGTEPVVRYYAESSSRDDLDELLECGKQWITGA